MSIFNEEIILYITITIIVAKMIHIFHKHKMESGTPAFLTTLGIFGTFAGMVIGLFPFMMGLNTDIVANLPTLINGIAIACICSTTGVGLSLWSKSVQNKARRNTTGQLEKTGATIDTLAQLLTAILESQKVQALSTSTLQKSIAGDEDGSLLTQLQKIRTQFTDKQDELINEFKDFAQTMSQNNTDALIEALSSVITDFNEKISEQFGENFKHLNEAVGKLLEWQIFYKDEIHTLNNQFELCLRGIENAKNALESISEKSIRVVNTAETLGDLLTTYQDQKNKLSENLVAFASLSQDANEAFPIIHENINKVTKQFSEISEEMILSQRTMLGTQNEFLNEVIGSYELMDQKLIDSSEKIFMESQTHIKGVADNLNLTLSEISEKIKSQITALDQALEEELTKSLSSLGNQMSSLSAKFVSDYKPLTEKLHKILQIADRLGAA